MGLQALLANTTGNALAPGALAYLHTPGARPLVQLRTSGGNAPGGSFQGHNKLCMAKAVAYLRVSGKGQEAGDGYARQLQSINRYATANDIVRTVELVQPEFRHQSVSGRGEKDCGPGDR